MLRVLKLSAFCAGVVVSSGAVAQTRDVETVAGPGPDVRHRTAVVTHLELDSSTGDDVASAIDRVAGVHSRRTSYGQSAYATVRGSNSRQVLVEYEGLRLNPPFGPGFDLGGVGLGFDSVSIWRGAAATYRGSGALAGVLEFRTAHSRKPGASIEGSALRGSHDTLAGGVQAAVAGRNVSTRVGVGGRSSDGDFYFTDAQGTRSRRVNNDHERGAAFGSTEVRDGKGWLRATVFTDRGERGTPGLSEFQEQFGEARLRDQQTAAIVGVGGTGGAAGDWSLDSSLRAGVQMRGYQYDNPEPFLGDVPIHEETRATTVSAMGDGTAWGPRSVARVAADVRHDDWRSTTDAERLTGGLGASWEQAIAKRWVAVGALRGEVDSDGRSAALPAVGAQVELADAWTVQANVGRTFRAPNLDELYLELESVRGNPELTSERAWVGDLGVRWAGEHHAATATAFGRLVDSEILFLPVTAYLVEAQNIEGTWASGVETELTLDARPFRAQFAYTLTVARFQETNTPVPLQPTHAADARVGVTVLRAIEMWTGAHLRGPTTLDVFGNTRDGAHAFWDVGLVVGKRPVRMALTVRNVLDDDGAVDATQQPMPGRTLWASIRMHWQDR